MYARMYACMHACMYPGMYACADKKKTFHDAHSVDCDARGVARTGKIGEHSLATRSLVPSRQEFGEGALEGGLLCLTSGLMIFFGGKKRGDSPVDPT